MQLEDKGYLLSKSRYNENSVIGEIFSEKHGKISGIIFGATSKKLKNYLQIGNKFHINFNSMNDARVGYFKVEIDQVLTPIKTLYNFNAINITLGLPFIRISPDHGPNNKMIGQKRSDPSSLREALIFLRKINGN